MIYFVQAVGVGNIKIGWTEGTDAAQRMRDMQVGSPVPLSLLRTIPGDRTLEQELHRRFAFAHVHGEWFRAVPELLAFIASERGPENNGTQPGAELRYVAVKVMTIGGKQVTQTFFRQIPEQDIVNWSFVRSRFSSPNFEDIPLDVFFLGTRWGKVRYDCKEDSNVFQLVWQRHDELRRCLCAPWLSQSWMNSQFGTRGGVPVSVEEWHLNQAQKDIVAACKKLWTRIYAELSSLDHLFIGC